MSRSQAQRRQQAITRYLDGDKVDDICEQMGCSKSWLYKWKSRYQPDDPDWYQERSRRPLTPPSKTPVSIELAIRTARQSLRQGGEPAGAAAIRESLHQQGVEPLPSARTIYRILRRPKTDDPATP